MESTDRFRLNFRYWRLQKGISLISLQICSGVPPARIKKFERGHCTMRKSEQEALAEGIGTTRSELLKQDPPRFPLFISDETGFKIREKMERFRKSSGISLKGFCRKIQMTPNGWRTGLKRQRGIRMETVLRIMRVFGLSPEEMDF